ncbi:MAG TPA: CHASE3 domain-containing protein [Gemmatimonadales bacterium]|jgi:PAS domain S-box-containing protein
MKRNVDHLLTLTIIAALIVTAGNSILAIRNLNYLYQATEDVARTRGVLQSLDELLSTAKDAETGQRGFVITGDAVYLEPYYAAAGAITQRLATVDSLTRGDSLEQARLPRLTGLLTTKMSELRQTIELRQTAGFAAAEAMIQAGVGRMVMDSVRGEVVRMSDEEARLLRLRAARAAEARNRTVESVVAAGVLELLTLLVLTLAIRRHLRARDRSRVALYDQKETFRTTLASIGDAVITTDTAGRIVFLNEVARTLTGWSTEDAVGKPLETIFRIVNETTRAEVANPALRALRDGTIVGLANHTLLINRDGSETPIDDSAAPIRNADLVVTGAVLVFRDITESKAADRALRDADRRKDEFLAVLAHELRNPLAPLRNALEGLRLSPGDARVVEQSGAIMERQLHHMVRLIDDLLDVSRITRNRLELRFDTVDIATIVHAATETCGPLLRESGHGLRVTLPPQPIHVRADAGRLGQAFGNLLNNAIKYTDRSGTIWLSVEPSDGGVAIRVRDSGVGIPGNMLQEIFEMFVQVDRSLERTRGGLGIGLPLVKRIVMLHGGTVTPRSDGPGKGSEFTVWLPVVEAPESGPVDAATPAQPMVRRRILVADDNVDATSSLATMLRLMGHDVCVANDGEAAVREGALFHPHIALLDIGMPKLNGYDTARQIRASVWGSGVLLVALTGWGQDEDRRRSEAAGFDHHMVKPVDLEALQRILASR